MRYNMELIMTIKTDLTLDPVVANFSQLSDDVLIRPKQAKLILGVSIATFWRLSKQSKFNLIRVTERTTAIRAGDLRAFMAKGV